MKEEKTNAPFEIILVIVQRDKGSEVCSFLRENSSTFHLVSMGEGTSESVAAEVFGFGIQERDIVFGLIKQTKSEEVLQLLSDKFSFAEQNNGLAITMPINSTTNVVLDMVKNMIK